MGVVDRKPLILLVECDTLIGLDLSEALTLAGYRVAGPATTLRDTDVILGRVKPDAAILDAALEDGDCAVIARLLHRDGVPFLVHAPSSRDAAASDAFRDAPWLLKPARPGDVISTLDGFALATMRA